MSYLLNLIFNHTLNKKLNPSKVLFARESFQKIFRYSIEAVSFDKTGV